MKCNSVIFSVMIVVLFSFCSMCVVISILSVGVKLYRIEVVLNRFNLVRNCFLYLSFFVIWVFGSNFMMIVV